MFSQPFYEDYDHKRTWISRLNYFDFIHTTSLAFLLNRQLIHRSFLDNQLVSVTCVATRNEQRSCNTRESSKNRQHFCIQVEVERVVTLSGSGLKNWTGSTMARCPSLHPWHCAPRDWFYRPAKGYLTSPNPLSRSVDLTRWQATVWHSTVEIRELQDRQEKKDRGKEKKSKRATPSCQAVEHQIIRARGEDGARKGERADGGQE